MVIFTDDRLTRNHCKIGDHPLQIASQIRIIGRATQGVRIMNLKEGETVQDIAKVITDQDEDGDADAEATEPTDANSEETSGTEE